MKKLGSFLLIICFLSLTIQTEAASSYIDLYWETGTEIRLYASISSTELESGSHQLIVRVTLLDLDIEAYDIHDIVVDIQIPGYYTNYLSFNPISTIGGSQERSTTIQYSTTWGVNYLQMKITCREDIPLAIDPELYCDWYNFFTLEPYDTPTTPTEPTDPSGINGIENPNLLPIILGTVGGVLGLGIIIATTVVLTQRQKTAIKTEQVPHSTKIVAKPNFCTNCGLEIKVDDQFCSNCGARKST
jgi:hypothetical protein